MTVCKRTRQPGYRQACGCERRERDFFRTAAAPPAPRNRFAPAVATIRVRPHCRKWECDRRDHPGV